MIPLSAFRPTAEGGGSRHRHRCGGLSCEQSRIVLPRRRPRLSAPRLGHDRKRAPPRDSSGRRRGGVYGLPFEGGGSPGRRWDRRWMVREIVRAIRLVQPLVLVSRWQGGPEDGHGQHQAIGLVMAEAFDAAADPSAFPELREAGLAPWQPRKLYRSAVGDWQPGEDVTFGARLPQLERAGLLSINSGMFDPISGRSYQELAGIGISRHQSQAMAFLPRRGDHFSYYRLERSLVTTGEPEQGLFDGLDPTLPGLPDHAGSTVRGLDRFLEESKHHAEEAASAYRPARPAEAGHSVLKGLGALRLARDLLSEESDGDTRLALDQTLARKVREFEEAAARCLGLDVESLIDQHRLTPGRKVQVTARLWNAGDQRVDGAEMHLEVPEAWTGSRRRSPATESHGADVHPQGYLRRWLPGARPDGRTTGRSAPPRAAQAAAGGRPRGPRGARARAAEHAR